jgi:hypothetical protein
MQPRLLGMLVLVILGLGFGTVAQASASTVLDEASHHAEGLGAIGSVPAFWVEDLSISPAQCSLESGVCTVAIANKGINSSYDLVLAPDGCQIDVISAKNSETTTTTTLNGTVGGQILSGIQAGSNVLASCAVPIPALVYETNGSAASGIFLLKLVNGSMVGAPFSGVWTNSTECHPGSCSQLYQLEFVQDSNCPYGEWRLPWAVVLNNSNIVVQPSNAPLSSLTYPGNYSLSPEQQLAGSEGNYSTISFSVPNGTYDYTIVPKDPFNREQSGSVTINGSDVQVEVWEFVTAMGCTTSTATISTSSTTATTTVVSTYISTVVSTSISTSSNSTALYGVAAIAAVIIIAIGYLGMRGRKPA